MTDVGPDPAAPPPPRTAVGARRAVADIAIQIVGRFGNIVLGIVATAVLARGLGDAGYGDWTTLLLVPTLLGYFTELGLQQTAVRQAAADGNERWIGALVTIRLFTGIPVILAALVVYAAIGIRGDTLLAGVLLSLQGILGAPGAAAAAGAQLHVRNDTLIVAMTANSVAWTGVVVVLAAQDRSILAFAACFILITFATTAGQLYLIRGFISIPLRGLGNLPWRLIKIAAPLSVGSILIAAYGKIDGIIVFSAAGSEAAGLYGAAYRILDQAAFVPSALTVTLMPILATVWPGDRDRARRIAQSMIEILGIAGLLAVVVGAVGGRELIVVFYGDEFRDAGRAMLPLMLAYAVITMGYACGVYTLVLGLTRRFAVYAGVALVFNVAANLALVPPFGYLAAAWITFGTELLVTALIARDILRELEWRPEAQPLLRTLAAAVVTGGLAVLCRAAGAGEILVLLTIGVLYGVTLVGFGALRIDRIRALLRREVVPS